MCVYNILKIKAYSVLCHKRHYYVQFRSGSPGGAEWCVEKVRIIMQCVVTMPCQHGLIINDYKSMIFENKS